MLGFNYCFKANELILFDQIGKNFITQSVSFLCSTARQDIFFIIDDSHFDTFHCNQGSAFIAWAFGDKQNCVFDILSISHQESILLSVDYIRVGLGWGRPGNGQGWSKSGDATTSHKAWCLEKAHGFSRERCYGTNHAPEGWVPSNFPGESINSSCNSRIWSDPNTDAEEPSSDWLVTGEFSNDTPSFKQGEVKLPWKGWGVYGGIRKEEEKVPNSLEQAAPGKEAASSIRKRKLWRSTCEIRQPHRQSGSRWRQREKRRKRQREAAWKRKREIEGEVEGQAKRKREGQIKEGGCEAEGIPCSWRGGREGEEKLDDVGAAMTSWTGGKPFVKWDLWKVSTS